MSVIEPPPDPREFGNELVSAQAFADLPRIHRVLARLRRHGRPLWVTPDNYRPFWAVGRHAQVVEASSDNALFISSRRLNLMSRLQEAAAFKGAERYGRVLRTLVHMDEPDHKKYRAVAQYWFTAAAVKRQQTILEALAREFSAHFDSARNGEIDFAAEIATLFPLRVIMVILGIPLEDLPLMHRLTKTLSAPNDPDFSSDTARGDSMFDSIPEFTDYFLKVIADRRRQPRDDLASVIANGSIDGGPLGELEAVSYFITLAVAGHDTTAAALAGGCEALALYYLSANFDDQVFREPLEFRIDRNPNKQIAFGFGPHVCLGMALSRLELTTWFGEMLRRVDALEMAGPVRLLESNFLGGYKSVPIRCTLAGGAKR